MNIRIISLALLCCLISLNAAAQDGKKGKKKAKQETSSQQDKDDLKPVEKKKEKKPKAEKSESEANKQEKTEKPAKAAKEKPQKESKNNDAPKAVKEKKGGKPDIRKIAAEDSVRKAKEAQAGADPARARNKKPGKEVKEEPAKPRPANVEVKVDDPVDRTRKGPSGQTIYTAPRGGKYYINASGNKVFVTNNTK
ncbi:MAG: hypothetical protein U0T84_03700 [Chitinophagales bacterium]